MKVFTQGQTIVGLALVSSLAQAQQQILSIPNHPDYECSVGNKKDGTVEFCGSKKLNVQIVEVISVAGAVTGCLAVMPYNRLNIYFDRSGATKGSLTWVLPSSSLSAGASVDWADEGVAVLAESTKARKRTFADDGLVVGKEFTIPLRDPQSNSPPHGFKKRYNHLPSVSYKPSSTAPAFDCLGIDPVIANFEN